MQLEKNSLIENFEFSLILILGQGKNFDTYLVNMAGTFFLTDLHL